MTATGTTETRARSAEPGLAQQVLRFAAVGVLGTAAYLLLYLLLRPVEGPQAASVTARVLLAVATTWLNGRVTFHTQVSRARLWLGALAALAVGTGISSGMLAMELWWVGHPARTPELATLAVANVLAAVGRFVVLRSWVFRSPAVGPPPGTR